METPFTVHEICTLRTHWKAEQKSGDATFLEGREQHLKRLLRLPRRPHADDPAARKEHHVVGHRAAELGFQVLHRAARHTPPRSSCIRWNSASHSPRTVVRSVKQRRCDHFPAKREAVQ